ncbi:18.3 kDa class I heat shock protein-like [Gossypium hirsutum]|uniref:18.3 kDa class I heat shock protein-like n=1 Tax=Gossypium hirsutum TaxID=3635 RepID=A0A1U8KPJ8_GOSHI|nr:18.3 kDa class I heat shock protein-like [Gossypium hirsutum]
MAVARRFPDVFFNSALANTVPSSSSACEALAIANARVDWKETPKAHVFKAILQGLKKGWLPENAKMDQVKASMENGPQGRRQET